MNTRTMYTPSPSGDFISARAARRVSAHRRSGAAPAPAPVSGPRILRRWSVAELIARAAVRPPEVA